MHTTLLFAAPSPAMRRSARVAAAVESTTFALAPLPLPLVRHIFSSLPVDSRARAACVARGWRAALADPALWTRLDLSEGGGVAKKRVTELFLRGAVAKALGQLSELDLSGASGHRITETALLEVVAHNAHSLRSLRMNILRYPPSVQNYVEVHTVEALARAAPQLQRLETNTRCSWVDAPRLMRAGPPLTALRLTELNVRFANFGVGPLVGGIERVAPFAASLTDTALQPTLKRVGIVRADVRRPELLDVFVDAALARQLELSFCYCTPPAPGPLARLLRGASLTHLEIFSRATAAPPFDAAGAALVAAALRANTTITSISLYDASMCCDMGAACTVLGALVGHPSLRRINLEHEFNADEPAEEPADRAALGAALAAIVAADTLHRLVLDSTKLGDVNMAPIVNALPRLRHLRELNVCLMDLSEEFVRERLLPAVRANASLRKLMVSPLSLDFTESSPAAAEAEAVVRRRQLHD